MKNYLGETGTSHKNVRKLSVWDSYKTLPNKTNFWNSFLDNTNLLNASIINVLKFILRDGFPDRRSWKIAESKQINISFL